MSAVLVRNPDIPLTRGHGRTVPQKQAVGSINHQPGTKQQSNKQQRALFTILQAD